MLLHSAVSLLLLLPLPSQDPRPIDPERKRAALEELDIAFGKGGSPEARAAAIDRCRDLDDADVIALVRKGLDDKDERVLEAALKTLGALKHESSLAAMHAFLKRDKKKLAEKQSLLALAYKEIGRHGDESSLPLLTEDPFDTRAFALCQARILSIGNIRSTNSIEALIDMSKKVGVNRMEGLRQDTRLALARLTGQDLGPVSTQWLAWWQENEKEFRMSPEARELDPALERQWKRYWGIEQAGRGGQGRGGEGRERGRGGEPGG